MRTDTGQVFRLEEYKPSAYRIPRLELDFRLDAQETLVTARMQVERAEGTDVGTPLVLDGDGLSLVGLAVNGEPAGENGFEALPDQLTLRDVPAGDHFELEIVTRINPSANKALMGLYVSSGVFCTQCEAEGFRRITYFLDRPDVLSTYRVRMEADRATAPLLLSNGNPVENGDLDGGRHYAIWDDPHPKPSYLFALVAGNLGVVSDHFITASGRKVALGVYVEHGKEARATYAMDALKRSMRWDEERFGREYDLDVFNIVAVSDFNMGAMENKGLNIFNDKYVLADPETATDMDFANIEAIIAHEYFHNWTGNRITCRDWFQLCLKEGLTVYRDHEFSADMRSRAVRRISEVRTLRAHQFPEDQGPLAHPVRPRRYREINNFYTATVYEKGSEVVRMIHTILGEEDFRKGMDLYFDRHDGQAVTIEDLIACFEEAGRVDLTQFALWYHQAGTPNVIASTSYDEQAKSFTLELEQSVPPTPSEARKKAMHIPLKFGLVGPNGEDMDWASADGAEISGDVIHLRERRHTISFKGIGQRPVLSLNRGFSAPVVLSEQVSSADRYFLAQHDSDAFNRWQALNSLANEALIEAANQARNGTVPGFDDELVSFPAGIAGDETLEPAYRALAITPPAEADIAREIGGNVDPDAIHRAREAYLDAVARSGATQMASVYDALADDGTFNPDAGHAGKRALRNVLLGLLMRAEGSPERGVVQYRSATNMTERLAALMEVTHRFANSPEASELLADFEGRYSDNPLVMDKWLTTQATIPGDGAAARVRELMKHSSFSLSNPNRVRALIGGFASGNQTGFHAADGTGYQLLAETILAVEELNPQVAARLAVTFRSWRSLEPHRQKLAREALATIAKAENLSRDLRDIVDRTLA
ncbi:aminopeptidase N [Nitratireductor basaltis]|uniref:Aminopeptidase N n=1 Tax=Nitratireductor basaltis TaxID=472175 RepID=A0A084UCE0_9HYPH|nr:aminopeptidase N [Nitratireductor basaltis]KFB10626.1 Aminopeptidase N [Nitratireductor basaltis]